MEKHIPKPIQEGQNIIKKNATWYSTMKRKSYIQKQMHQG